MSKTYMTKQEKKAAAKFEKNNNNISALQKDDIILPYIHVFHQKIK